MNRPMMRWGVAAGIAVLCGGVAWLAGAVRDPGTAAHEVATADQPHLKLPSLMGAITAAPDVAPAAPASDGLPDDGPTTTPSPPTAPRSTTPPIETEPRSDPASEQARVAALDAAFRQQPGEASASAAARDALRQALVNDAAAPSIQVRTYECRGTACRIDLIAGSATELDGYMDAMLSRLSTSGSFSSLTAGQQQRSGDSLILSVYVRQ